MLRSLNTLRSAFSWRSSGLLLSVSLLVLSLVASLFSPLVANAASDYDNTYQTTDTLILKSAGCTDVNINTTYLNYLTQEDRDSLSIARESGSWGISYLPQWNNMSTGDTGVIIFWNETAQMNATFSTSGGDRWLQTNDYQHGRSIQMKPVSGYGESCGFVAQNFGAGYLSHESGSGGNPSVVNFLYTGTVTYPPDYQGSGVRDSVDAEPVPTISPEIEYIVQNKKVTLKYMGNIQHQSCPVMNWTTYKQDNEDTPVDQKLDQPPQNDYTFTVSEYGKYIFIADLHVPVPCAPFPDDYVVVPTLITLDIDGSSFEGSNSDLICEVRPDGYNGCVTPDAASCNLQETFIEQMSCRFEKSVNMGLINPTINAFKDVISSFVVVSPSCQIIIGDVAILPGQNFPLSDYSTYACDSAAEFREAFPIAPVLLNFFLALSWLYLVVRIINRLLNHEKNDVIEGVA